MDYKNVASTIYEKIGGKENLISAAHCATRLRLVIADNQKCSKEVLENIEGVKGVFFASGQLQIIFGTGIVNKVFDEFIEISHITASTKEDLKQQASAKTNLLQRAIKTLGDIFVPIIPAIVASGFLMGIMEALNFMVNNGFLSIDTSGSIYTFSQLFSNTAYVFLPILIAFSAAKVFGGNPFLGAVIGMIMIHPNLQNAWSVATEGVQATQSVFFGVYSVSMVGYQGHVIPVIIAVFVMSTIEKKLHKIVPPMIDLFVTPLASVFITGYLTLAAIGPVFVWLENGLLDGVQALISLPLGIGSFIMGGAYATTVVTGIHHMYTIIDLGQISKFGLTFWLPLASAANVAQGGAALAVGIKTKNQKLKSLALPSSLSAFMGITEPAIFGVNLRFIKPFIAGSIGGACGALYASIVQLGATGTGVTGIFGILLHLNRPVQYSITMLIAVGVAFAISWVLWKDTAEEAVHAVEESESELADNGQNDVLVEMEPKDEATMTIRSPLSGRVFPLREMSDPIFSGEVLGKGVAIAPEVGRIVAPFDAIVTALVDTKHAIALTNEEGLELLIHIGVDTVQLNGEHFTAHVTQDCHVKAGDLLLEFDIEKIKAAGFEVTTPVIIANTDNYQEIIGVAEQARILEPIIIVKGRRTQV